MMVKLKQATLIILTLVAASPAFAEDDYSSTLVSSYEMDLLDVRKVQISGEYAQGKIEITSTVIHRASQEYLEIEVMNSDESMGTFQISAQEIPDFDVGTMVFMARDFSDSGLNIKIEMKFGGYRRCFVNDDGRNRLVVDFYEKNDPSSYVVSYDNCEPRKLD